MSATHFGDPCIHCGIPHDDVPIGPCQGDREKARILAYCVWRQAYENPGSGCDTILCKMTDGSIREEHWRPEYWWWDFDNFKAATVLAPHEFKQRFIPPTPAHKER